MQSKVFILALALAIAAARPQDGHGHGHDHGHGHGHAYSSQSIVLHQTHHGHEEHAPVHHHEIQPVVHVQEHHEAPKHESHHEEHHEDYYAIPKYSYEYKVEDPHTHDLKHQHETRDHDVVKGEYGLHQPDGTIRIVKYYADHKNGFHADVHYEGHAKHIVPEHHHHH